MIKVKSILQFIHRFFSWTTPSEKTIKLDKNINSNSDKPRLFVLSDDESNDEFAKEMCWLSIISSEQVKLCVDSVGNENTYEKDENLEKHLNEKQLELVEIIKNKELSDNERGQAIEDFLPKDNEQGNLKKKAVMHLINVLCDLLLDESEEFVTKERFVHALAFIEISNRKIMEVLSICMKSGDLDFTQTTEHALKILSRGMYLDYKKEFEYPRTPPFNFID